MLENLILLDQLGVTFIFVFLHGSKHPLNRIFHFLVAIGIEHFHDIGFKGLGKLGGDAGMLALGLFNPSDPFIRLDSFYL